MLRYGNSVTFRIWVALEYLQYLDNHESQRFDFCIECTPTDSTCQLYHHQVKIMIIYEGTNNLVSGAFLKCFRIGQGQPMVIIYINFVQLESPMLCAKFQDHRTSGSEKKIFKSFYHIWAWWPSWSCDLYHLYKLSFPLPRETPHKIWA